MSITPYNSDNLSYLKEKIVAYYDLRGYVTPSLKDAAIWLATEVGELLDAIMRTEKDWVRNNPDKPSKVEEELADVMMMLLVAAGAADVDPMDALLRKMNRKTGGELLAGQLHSPEYSNPDPKPVRHNMINLWTYDNE